MSKVIVSTCVLAALVCALTAPATAYTPDRRTLFTFNQPIALPGVTLPAGTYTFRLADPATGSKVVQVLNHSGTQSFAMLLSIPTVRQDIPREPEIGFMDTAAGMPAAGWVWWQARTTRGYENTYPNEQVERLPQGAVPAPADFGSRSSALADPDVARRSPASPVFGEPPAEETSDALVAAQAENSFSSAQASGQQGRLTQPAPSFAQDPTASSEGQRTRRNCLEQQASCPLRY
jgi:hypothetical protein